MGRPRKQTLNYFPHFASTDSRTRFILEQNWGNDGYAFWFKLLELLCRSEGQYYDLSEASNGMYLEAMMRVDAETVSAILNILADLGSIDKTLWEERKIVWCQSLIDNVQDVYSKRTDPAPVKPFTESHPEEAPVKPFTESHTEEAPEPPAKKRGRPPKTPEGGQGSQRGVCDEVVALYNEICVSFPRLKSLSEARKKAIKARLASGYTIESFKELFQRAEASRFLKGKNDRNWQATFDWLIKDSNMAKVIDGNYTDKGGNNFGTGTDRGDTAGQPTTPGAFKPSGGFKG